MNLKYEPPKLNIEVLEKCDVLTSSAETPEESTKKFELENAYGDFLSFVLSPDSWFD